MSAGVVLDGLDESVVVGFGEHCHDDGLGAFGLGLFVDVVLQIGFGGSGQGRLGNLAGGRRARSRQRARPRARVVLGGAGGSIVGWIRRVNVDLFGGHVSLYVRRRIHASGIVRGRGSVDGSNKAIAG